MYITTYAADAWALLDTRRLWQHYHNSYLMSECKHHLMDSAVMRNGPHTPTCWKTTSLASRLNVTVKVVKTCSFFKKKYTQHLFDWADEMITIWHRICSRTRDGVCYHSASLLSSCIILKSVSYKMTACEGESWQWVCCMQNQPVSQKTKAMTPWFTPVKNNELQSALWNPSLCRQF